MRQEPCPEVVVASLTLNLQNVEDEKVVFLN